MKVCSPWRKSQVGSSSLKVLRTVWSETRMMWANNPRSYGIQEVWKTLKTKALEKKFLLFMALGMLHLGNIKFWVFRTRNKKLYQCGTLKADNPRHVVSWEHYAQGIRDPEIHQALETRDPGHINPWDNRVINI